MTAEIPQKLSYKQIDRMSIAEREDLKRSKPAAFWKWVNHRKREKNLALQKVKDTEDKIWMMHMAGEDEASICKSLQDVGPFKVRRVITQRREALGFAPVKLAEGLLSERVGRMLSDLESQKILLERELEKIEAASARGEEWWDTEQTQMDAAVRDRDGNQTGDMGTVTKTTKRIRIDRAKAQVAAQIIGIYKEFFGNVGKLIPANTVIFQDNRSVLRGMDISELDRQLEIVQAEITPQQSPMEDVENHA